MKRRNIKMGVFLIIPAHLESSRVPEKVIKEIGNQSIIKQCFTCCYRTGYPVYLCLDSLIPRVLEERHGNKWEDKVIPGGLDYNPMIITNMPFHNGTERVQCASQFLRVSPFDVIVNVQGDMAHISPDTINAVVAHKLELSEDSNHACTIRENIVVTAHRRLVSADEWGNPDRVKLRVGKTGLVDQFFRKDKLSARCSPDDIYGVHIGIYAFTAGYLTQYVERGPCFAEKQYKLEQLRIWDMGGQIMSVEVDESPVVIDNELDLMAAQSDADQFSPLKAA
jgi:3-deoxy-manno-octulosonate cytidylyltransferase (CMP-KDO synthetase)